MPTPDRSLRPGDAAVAFRSFPRRFRAVVARPDDDEQAVDPDELARRIGPEGASAADHLLAADGVTALLDGALEVALRGHDGDLVFHPAFADLSDATWQDPHSPLAAMLDRFEATATRAADRIDAMPAERWSARAPLAGSDRTLELIEATQDTVAVVSHHLRAAQEVIDAVRR